jgi:hypothetical protein
MEAVVLLILGALASLLTAEYAKRPRLVIESAGLQSGPLCLYMLNVSNVPGFIGIRFGRTILFGRVIHGRFSKGVDIERRVARDVRLNLEQEGTLSAVPLWMRPRVGDQFGLPTLVTSLNSGKTALVCAIGRRSDDNGFYMAPAWPASGDDAPNPSLGVKVTESKSFVARVRSPGARLGTYRFSVVQTAEGLWAIERITRREKSHSAF